MSEKALNFTVDRDLHKRLKIKAANEDTTVAELMRQAAREKLEREGDGTTRPRPAARAEAVAG